MDNNDFEWRAFINLGERIGDGDLEGSERKYVNSEYKRLAKLLIPEYKELDRERKEAKDLKIKEFLLTRKCVCNGTLIQNRKFSKKVHCLECNKIYLIKIK